MRALRFLLLSFGALGALFYLGGRGWFLVVGGIVMVGLSLTLGLALADRRPSGPIWDRFYAKDEARPTWRRWLDAGFCLVFGVASIILGAHLVLR